VQPKKNKKKNGARICMLEMPVYYPNMSPLVGPYLKIPSLTFPTDDDRQILSTRQRARIQGAGKFLVIGFFSFKFLNSIYTFFNHTRGSIF
jgi:hypothetical protein